MTTRARGALLAGAALVVVAGALVVVAAVRDDDAPAAAAPCSEIDYSRPSQGRLSFADDFDGDAVDTSRWNVRDGTKLSFDRARIQASNVTVHDGMLDIAGRYEPRQQDDRDWTTGYLDTIGHFSQERGRWEMRAKVSTDATMTRGVWPAFWLRGDGTRGEIDVMETWGSPDAQPGYDPSASYAWTVLRDTTDHPAGKITGWAHPQDHTPPIYRDFHVYAVDWSKDCLRFSFDGRTVGTVDLDSRPWLRTALTGPFNIRLNQQVGLDYWGQPNPGQTRAGFDYLVDYVRAYSTR